MAVSEAVAAPIDEIVESVELAPRINKFHLEPRCRVCRNDVVRKKVNDLLAVGAGYATTSPAPRRTNRRLWIWILGVGFVVIAIALFVPLAVSRLSVGGVADRRCCRECRFRVVRRYQRVSALILTRLWARMPCPVQIRAPFGQPGLWR